MEMQDLNSISTVEIQEGDPRNLSFNTGAKRPVSTLPEGVLKQNEDAFRFETVDQKIEALSIEQIQHFELIPDYQVPTDYPLPQVVSTPEGFICVDGWNLIEEERAKGETSIRCYVEYVTCHRDLEVAIRKVETRIKPRGGFASYAEKIRNVKTLYGLLFTAHNDLNALGHGGRRRGKNFSNEKLNARDVLANRLGKSVTTIRQMLNHASFLSDETLRYFVDQEVYKDFFEMANPNKQFHFKMLRSQEIPDEKITIEISALMKGWYEEWWETEKIAPIYKTAEVIEQVEETPESSPAIKNEQAPSISHQESNGSQEGVTGNEEYTSPPIDSSEELRLHEVLNTPEVAGEEKTGEPDETVSPPQSTTRNSIVQQQTPELHEAQQVPDESPEEYSLDDVKHDIQDMCENLLAASDLSDPKLYLDQLFAAANSLTHAVQQVKALADPDSEERKAVHG